MLDGHHLAESEGTYAPVGSLATFFSGFAGTRRDLFSQDQSPLTVFRLVGAMAVRGPLCWCGSHRGRFQLLPSRSRQHATRMGSIADVGGLHGFVDSPTRRAHQYLNRPMAPRSIACRGRRERCVLVLERGSKRRRLAALPSRAVRFLASRRAAARVVSYPLCRHRIPRRRSRGVWCSERFRVGRSKNLCDRTDCQRSHAQTPRGRRRSCLPCQNAASTYAGNGCRSAVERAFAADSGGGSVICWG